MYNVLIADDEPKIRQRLAQLIDWQALGFCITGYAENGRQALDFVRSNDVDLCLVDVCMPQLNGLELIRAIHSENERLCCIVVSGFDEFEYAQECIELNVQQYLLKPVTAAALEKAVRSAAKSLAQRSARDTEFETALKLADKSIQLLREKFLSQLAQGLLTREEIAEEIRLLSLSDARSYSLLLMAGGEENMGYTVREQELYRLRLEHSWRAICGDAIITTFDAYDNIIGLFRTDDDRIHALRKAYPGISVYGGLTIQDVPHCYEGWSEGVQDKSDPLALKIMTLVEAHYGEEDFDLSSASEALHISAGHIGRLMRRQTGMTFNEYLTKTRIRIACMLLSRTQLRIYEVSDRVGYASQHYFCTAFRRVMGVSPSEYRSVSAHEGG